MPYNGSYNFVVVGGGTAGCVIAARLTEDPEVRVLLIEAGAKEALPEMATPVVSPTLMGTSANWGDNTVAQDFIGWIGVVLLGRQVPSGCRTKGIAKAELRGDFALSDSGRRFWRFDEPASNYIRKPRGMDR